MLAGACAAGKPAVVAAAAAPPPAAKKIDAAPAAVRPPDAPGLNVEDLSARLRDAMTLTSGVDVVDDLSVRAELAACEEAPCPDVVAQKYRDAEYVVASSVSRVGDVFLTTVRVQKGSEELVRATAQSQDARASVEAAGHEAGARLRAKLVAAGAAERVAAPPGEAPPTTGAERGGEG